MEPQEIVSLVAGEHWPLFFAMAILWAGGWISKRLTAHRRAGAFWDAFHATMTVHPIVVGFAVGFVPHAPAPPSITSYGWLAVPVYYAGAGFGASFGYKFYRLWRLKSSSKE